MTLHERVEAPKDTVTTETLLNGVSVIRPYVGALTTERRHIERAFELIQLQAECLLAESL